MSKPRSRGWGLFGLLILVLLQGLLTRAAVAQVPDEASTVYLPMLYRDITALMEPVTVTPIPTVTRTPSITPSPTVTLTPSITPSPTATRTATATATATITPTATLTPTQSPTPVPPPAQLRIGYLKCDTSNEYVRVDNMGGVTANLARWKIYSTVGPQTFTFSSYSLSPGESVYVHSGPDASPTGGNRIRWTTAYIWNNDGDTAQLINPQGAMIDDDDC